MVERMRFLLKILALLGLLCQQALSWPQDPVPRLHVKHREFFIILFIHFCLDLIYFRDLTDNNLSLIKLLLNIINYLCTVVKYLPEIYAALVLGLSSLFDHPPVYIWINASSTSKLVNNKLLISFYQNLTQFCVIIFNLTFFNNNLWNQYIAKKIKIKY